MGGSWDPGIMGSRDHGIMGSYQPNFTYNFLKIIPIEEREYSKLRESNRQLVAVAKGLAGALLVVGGFAVASRLWSSGGPGGLTTHTVGVSIVTGEKLIQDIIGKAH